MQIPVINYHQAALGYLQNYYQSFSDENLFFGFPFIKNLVDEGERIAKAEGLSGIELENALLIVCFRFAGVTDITSENKVKYALLEDFAIQARYPGGDYQTVALSIRRNTRGDLPQTTTEEAAWDAIAYRFTLDDMIVHVSFLKEEMNRLGTKEYSEIQILSNIKEGLVRSRFYTAYAKARYGESRDRNFSRLEKRIQKLSEAQKKTPKTGNTSINLSGKETEDLFKIAFRNYVNLVSVADSKAGLLLNVNSIIISVVIAFVVGNVERYSHLLLPSFVLLGVAFITILLSILASRPQTNSLLEDKSSKSYQTFFFGSFDLIGSEFFKADWTTYSQELDTFLKGDKEKVYEEMYKEAFNVRKVLGKKFTYLSIAYWVFLCGLFLSILLFIINGVNHRV